MPVNPPRILFKINVGVEYLMYLFMLILLLLLFTFILKHLFIYFAPY